MKFQSIEMERYFYGLVTLNMHPYCWFLHLKHIWIEQVRVREPLNLCFVFSKAPGMYYNCIISPGYHASLWKGFIMSKPWSSWHTSFIVSLWLKTNITLEESFHKDYHCISLQNLTQYLSFFNKHQQTHYPFFKEFPYFDMLELYTLI